MQMLKDKFLDLIAWTLKKFYPDYFLALGRKFDGWKVYAQNRPPFRKKIPRELMLQELGFKKTEVEIFPGSSAYGFNIYRRPDKAKLGLFPDELGDEAVASCLRGVRTKKLEGKSSTLRYDEAQEKWVEYWWPEEKIQADIYRMAKEYRAKVGAN